MKLFQDTQPAIPVVEVPRDGPRPLMDDSWSLLIPIAVAGVISIATLAIVPIIKALGEIKKQNVDLQKQGEEIHKVVNSNFEKQTAELKAANEKIEALISAAKNNEARFKDLTDIIHSLNPKATRHIAKFKEIDIEEK